MSSRSFHNRRVARRLDSTGRGEIGIRNSYEGVCYTPSHSVSVGTRQGALLANNVIYSVASHPTLHYIGGGVQTKFPSVVLFIFK